MQAIIIIAALVTAGIAATTAAVASLPSAFAQEEIRGTYVVHIPVTETTQEEEAAVHYDPAEIAIPAGTTVLWFNDDSLQPHTVTSGSPEGENSGDLFDSGFMSEGSFFQHTFEEPGDYAYYCQFHPSAVGRVLVSDVFEEGENFRLSYGTGMTFDFTEQERTLLVFEPTSIDIDEDEPVTYQITILKDGGEVFTGEFRSLGGRLDLELIPTDGETRVTGPDISDPVIGAYHIQGNFLKDDGLFSIRAEITQLFDGPPQDELVDEFGIQIVPEFPLGIMLIVAAGIGATVFAGRIFKT